MSINKAIAEKAWEIRKMNINTMKEIANYFGVDEKERKAYS